MKVIMSDGNNVIFIRCDNGCENKSIKDILTENINKIVTDENSLRNKDQNSISELFFIHLEPYQIYD